MPPCGVGGGEDDPSVGIGPSVIAEEDCTLTGSETCDAWGQHSILISERMT
uniref:Uncharacterized protein n=1 Tax=Leptospira mayottensis 200901116 TaxID=1192864 RepID=A0A343US22_9LEPT|nr:hypothetical protein [Leptospira mayottensis 200901116]